MGVTARSIVDNNIVNELVKAYADEILAWYLYNFMANTISGALYPQLKEMLEEIAKSEYEHASELADMIVKLGGKPISDPMDLEDNANNPVIVAEEPLTLETVCKAVAESEANAIITYNDLARKTKDTDIATYQLVAHILSEEITHEELFENLK
jgi:bacterioferritin